MTIAVGLVHHRRAGEAPIRSEPGLDLLERTNAAEGGTPTPWLGFAANHELLRREAAGADWYVALNPDVEATAADMKRLVAAAEDAGLDVAAPRLGSPGRVLGARRALPGPGQWLRETVAGSASGAGGGAVERSAWVSAACMALREGVPEARFDEDYFMYFEDAALCHRVTAAGGRVGVCNGVLVGHRSGWSDDDPLRWRRGVEFARSALRFADETGSSPRSMRAAGLVRFGSRRLAPGRSAPERAGARAIARGFAGVGRRPGLRESAAEFNAERDR